MNDVDLNLPDSPSTEGRSHWYVVCARDEARANLVGPFFTPEVAQAEVSQTDAMRAAGANWACDAEHFVTPGPIPTDGRWAFGVRRPNLYADNAGHEWFEAWAYSWEGELQQLRCAILDREAKDRAPVYEATR